MPLLTRLSPERWTPPRAPGLTGRWERTGTLDDLELWPVPGVGPEDVVVTDDGAVHTGLQSGQLVRLTDGGIRVEVVGDGFGPILGLELLPDGDLLLCAADRGLFRVSPRTGARRPLATEVDGRPLVLTNNATVLADGTVLFTESSRRHRLEVYKHDLLEQTATGGLYRLDPDDGAVELVTDGFSFANGVTATADGSAAIVAETGRYRLHRVPLTGADAGRAEVLVDNLPGMPDNVSTGSDGTIWCAMASLRVAALDLLLPRPPVLRTVVANVPDALQPQPTHTAFVLGFGPDGEVRHNLRTDGGPVHFVTGVREHDGWLYLSSLVGTAIARTRSPA